MSSSATGQSSDGALGGASQKTKAAEGAEELALDTVQVEEGEEASGAVMTFVESSASPSGGELPYGSLAADPAADAGQSRIGEEPEMKFKESPILESAEEVAESPIAEMGTTSENEGTLPSHIDPNEIRRGIAMGGEDGKSREQIYYERLIKKVEPDLIGSIDRLSVYVELHKRELVNDTRLFPAEISATLDEVTGAIVVEGYVAFEETKKSFLNLLKYLNFNNVEDRIELLPSPLLGDKRFGLVIEPRAFTFLFRGEGRRESMTEMLYGDPVWLLKEGPENTVLVMSSEGYVAYAESAHIRRLNGVEFDNYRSGPYAQVIEDNLGPWNLPLGARMRVAESEERVLSGDSPTVKVEMPTGDIFPLPRAGLLIKSGEPSPVALKAIETAKTFLGTPYKWGGNSATGIDCSGLVQTSFRVHGYNFPRDTDQQVYLGELTGTRWHRTGMRPGDTLYFLGDRNGKISHTAIYLGNNEYIEATGPEAKITSFDPAAPNYDPKRDGGFCFAKRLIE